MIVKLHMEERHLIKGEQENDYACPIALLLMESQFCKMYNVFPLVIPNQIRFYIHTEETKTDPYDENGCKSRVAIPREESPDFETDLPEEVTNWISDYDDGETTTPLPTTVLQIENYSK